MLDVDGLVQAWQSYFKVNDWQQLIHDKTAKSSGCGLIYDLGNPLGRPNEDCSIADMRNTIIAEPHYHPAPNLEVYIVLQGNGLVIVGGQQSLIKKGSVVVIPPDRAHYTIPKGVVLAVVNTPPFKEDFYIPLTASNLAVRFDYPQFQKWSKRS